MTVGKEKYVMNMQSQIAAAKTTGPTFNEPRFDPAARQEHIDAILKYANRSRKGLSRLGEFSLAPARHDEAYSYFAQIRATPRSCFGGVEFRFDIPARSTRELDPQEVAENLLMAARKFNRLTGVGPYAKLVRAIVENALKPAADCLVPMRLAAFGMTMDVRRTDFQLTVDVEMLGDDLTVDVDRVSDNDIDRLDEKLVELVAKHMARQKLWTLATASRACGWIDDVARRIMEAAGLSCSEVVSRLRGSSDLDFYFGGDDGYDFSAALNWEDGVIRGHFRPIENDCDFGADYLTILRAKALDTDIASLPGRRFSDLYEQAFIPADALITAVATSDAWLYVRLAVGMSLIDEAAGSCRAPRCVA